MNKIPENQGEFIEPKKMTFFNWCSKNFPFIENTFEALDYYGLLSKVVGYLNQVIENLNTNENNINYLNENFKILQSWVDNYFTNLDVQKEINNKLDQMAASGQLDNIFQPYMRNIETELGVLTDRVNTFTTLPEGSTSANAELVDIRVGSDNKTYPNAGDAVRGQVSNIFQPIYQQNALLSINSGNINNNLGWGTLASYIPVHAIKSLTLKIYNNVGICYYGGDLKYISAQLSPSSSGQVISENDLIIPEGAVYLRLSYFYNDNFKIQFHNILSQVIENLGDNFSAGENAKGNDLYSFNATSNLFFIQFNINKIVESGTEIYYGLLDLNGDENFNNSAKTITLYAQRVSGGTWDTLSVINEPGIIRTITNYKYNLFRIFVEIPTAIGSNPVKATAVLSDVTNNSTIYEVLKANALNYTSNYLNNLSKIKKLQTEISAIKQTKILDISGNGDFTDFNTAVNYCRQNNCNLLVRKGDYIITDFTNVYIDFNILANEGARIIANYTGTDANIIQNYSPINLRNLSGTDVTIDGLTVIATNVRYCIHDEMGGGGTNYIHRFKNCNLIHNSEPTSTWNMPRCIGGGIGVNGRIEIDNCKFSCKIESAVDYHTDYNANQGTNGQNTLADSSKVSITNCLSKDSTVTCSTFTSNQLIKNQMYVSNCLLNKAPYVNKSQPTQGDNFELTSWNVQIVNN